MTEKQVNEFNKLPSIQKVMTLVEQRAESSSGALSTRERNYAAIMVRRIDTQLRNSGMTWNNVGVVECDLPMQIKRFARLGLDPNQSEFYVDVRNNKNSAKKDINLKLQYQGEMKLLVKFCKKGGGIRDFVTDVVMEGEELAIERDFKTGQLSIKEHKIPNLFKRDCTYANRDKCLGAYVIAYHNDGSQTTQLIGKDRINRAMSASATSGGVYKSDFQKMVIKTAIHDLYKQLVPFNVVPDDLLDDVSSVALGEDEVQSEIRENAMQGDIIDADVSIVEEPIEKPQTAVHDDVNRSSSSTSKTAQAEKKEVSSDDDVAW